MQEQPNPSFASMESRTLRRQGPVDSSSGLWSVHFVERPKHKYKPTRKFARRRFSEQFGPLSSYNKYSSNAGEILNDSTDKASYSVKDVANTDSQVLYLESNTQKGNTRSSNFVGISEDLKVEPYRAFTYTQLIALCKTKDKTIAKQSFALKSMKSDTLRGMGVKRPMPHDSTRGKVAVERNLNRFRVTLELNDTAAATNINIRNCMLQISWKPRQCRIVDFDIVNRVFIVATGTYVWHL